jgi:molecular chaperone GrpE
MYWDPFDPRRRRRPRPTNPFEEARRRAQEEEARRQAQAEALRRRLAEEEAARRRQQEEQAEARRIGAEPPAPPSVPQEPPAPPAAEAANAVAQAIAAEFEKELAAARRERDEWADKYQALQAETQTMRQRLQRNAEERAFETHRAALRRFLDVADNLERALASAIEDDSTLAEGVQLTYRELQRALADAGVIAIEAAGQPFDPALHEAIAAIAAPGTPADTVLEVVQRGYLFQDKLLRPAKVVIAQ